MRAISSVALACLCAAGLFVIAGPGVKPALAAPCTTTPRLTGSFIQPTLPDGLGTTWWNSELTYMQNACITQLVLQWSADSKTNEAWYPTNLPGWTRSSTDVVGLGLGSADANGVAVYVGLQINQDWFVNYANDTTWLSNQATIANQIADEIWQNYGTHTSFAGWYFPFEVDNYHFQTTTQQNNLINFFNTVFNHVHATSPGKPIIIAPFFNANLAGAQTPSQWQTMWTYILQNSAIDIIALQDGVGVGHATASQLPSWFSATKSAINAGRPSTLLWDDAETLTLDSQTSPLNQSAAIRTVVADMQAVQSYVTNFVSFSYNHYDSPNQVANEYDITYRDYLTNGVVETTPPTTPGTPSATAVNSITINLSWGASSHYIGVVGYKLYRNGSLVWNLYSTTQTSFSDSQLNPNTSYTYTVAAFDAAGNVSAQSASTSATTPPGTTYPTNLALGQTYTSTFPADADINSYPDTTPPKLTDGVYATQPPLLSDPAWRGVGTPTGGTFSFTIDLGSVQTIHEIDTDWFQYIGGSVFLPAQVVYAVSNDGSTFSSVGTVTKPAVSTDTQTKKYRLIDLSNVSGRYVRITVTPTGAAWTFIDEAEVRQ